MSENAYYYLQTAGALNTCPDSSFGSIGIFGSSQNEQLLPGPGLSGCVQESTQTSGRVAKFKGSKLDWEISVAFPQMSPLTEMSVP